MLEIYNSNELPGVPVRCEAYGDVYEPSTDAEGYFHFDVPVNQALPLSTRWEHVTLSTPGRGAAAEHQGSGSRARPRRQLGDHLRYRRYGRRDRRHRLRQELAPCPGRSAAGPARRSGRVVALQDDRQGSRRPARPFFYVSSSPWNLYGFIAEFMELNGIPHGPMFLKDYGVDRSQFIEKGMTSTSSTRSRRCSLSTRTCASS